MAMISKSDKPFNNATWLDINYSTFMSVEKTLKEVLEKLLSNSKLAKLLFYTSKHALELENLTQSQQLSLINEQIKIVPKLTIDPDMKPYVIISLDSFSPMSGEDTFRNATLSFDIFCPYEYWILGDYKLRPYSIAGEIDGMLSTSSFNKLGIGDFLGAKQLVLNEHLGGLSLYYNLSLYNDDVEQWMEETNG